MFVLINYLSETLDYWTSVCLFAETINTMSSLCNLCSILCISLDRFLFIAYPLRYIVWVTNKKVLSLVGLTWLYSLLGCSLTMHFANRLSHDLPCRYSIFLKPAVFYGFFLSQFMIITVTVIILYICIACMAWSQTKKIYISIANMQVNIAGGGKDLINHTHSSAINKDHHLKEINTSDVCVCRVPLEKTGKNDYCEEDYKDDCIPVDSDPCYLTSYEHERKEHETSIDEIGDTTENKRHARAISGYSKNRKVTLSHGISKYNPSALQPKVKCRSAMKIYNIGDDIAIKQEEMSPKKTSFHDEYSDISSAISINNGPLLRRELQTKSLASCSSHHKGNHIQHRQSHSANSNDTSKSTCKQSEYTLAATKNKQKKGMPGNRLGHSKKDLPELLHPKAPMTEIFSVSSVPGFRRQSQYSRQTTSSRRKQHKENKITRMLGLVLGVYLCAYIPSAITASILNGQVSSTAFMIDKTVALFWWSNSWANPLIYAWKNIEFRRAFKRLLGLESSAV